MSRRPKGKLVLYQPRRVDPARAGGSARASGDLLPLECLSIASWPVRDGYEVVLVDGDVHPPEEAHRRVVEACEGALLFATTGVLGHAIVDAVRCAEKVDARWPELPKVAGGWFASVRPEVLLRTGCFDAVVRGQGELVFRDLVAAVESGEPLHHVASCSTLLDGELVHARRRPVVGWDRLLDLPWHLVDADVELRRAQQMRADSWTDALRLPTPSWLGARAPYFGISYVSSFGCPGGCEFCCSPQVTGRAWEAMPAERLLDDLAALQARWGFDAVRFHDASFGTSEERARAFAEGVLARGLGFGWSALMASADVATYADETLDVLAESGLYSVEVGGASAAEAARGRRAQTAEDEDELIAVRKLGARGIDCRVTYVIGRPGESHARMLATLDRARRCELASPQSTPTIFPYRPVPGTRTWDQAVASGFRPPAELGAWAALGELSAGGERERPGEGVWQERIPPDVARVRALLGHYHAVTGTGSGGWLERLARWRLRTGHYALGELDAKLWNLQGRITGRDAGPPPGGPPPPAALGAPSDRVLR